MTKRQLSAGTEATCSSKIASTSTSTSTSQSNVLHDFWQQMTQEQDDGTTSYSSINFKCCQEIDVYLSEPVKQNAIPPALPDDPVSYWKGMPFMFILVLTVNVHLVLLETSAQTKEVHCQQKI